VDRHPGQIWVIDGPWAIATMVPLCKKDYAENRISTEIVIPVPKALSP
jgi:hypothetical protein